MLLPDRAVRVRSEERNAFLHRQPLFGGADAPPLPIGPLRKRPEREPRIDRLHGRVARRGNAQPFVQKGAPRVGPGHSVLSEAAFGHVHIARNERGLNLAEQSEFRKSAPLVGAADHHVVDPVTKAAVAAERIVHDPEAADSLVERGVSNCVEHRLDSLFPRGAQLVEHGVVAPVQAPRLARVVRVRGRQRSRAPSEAAVEEDLEPLIVNLPVAETRRQRRAREVVVIREDPERQRSFPMQLVVEREVLFHAVVVRAARMRAGHAPRGQLEACRLQRFLQNGAREDIPLHRPERRDRVAFGQDPVGAVDSRERERLAVGDVDVRAHALQQDRVRDAQRVEVAARERPPLGPSRVVIVPSPDPAIRRQPPRFLPHHFERVGQGLRGREVEKRPLFRPGRQMEMPVRDARQNRFSREPKLPRRGGRTGADVVLGADGDDRIARQKNGHPPDEPGSLPHDASGNEQTVHTRHPFNQNVPALYPFPLLHCDEAARFRSRESGSTIAASGVFHNPAIRIASPNISKRQSFRTHVVLSTGDEREERIDRILQQTRAFSA